MGVWLGNDDNSPMSRVTGGMLPAEIWNKVMTSLYKRGLIDDSLPDDQDVLLSEHDQARAAFYAGLSAAFAAHKPTQVAGLDPDNQTR